MSSKRFFYIMVGLLLVLVAGTVGSTYLASTMLAKKAAALSDLKVQDGVLTSEQTSLIKAKQDVVKYTPLETIAKSVVPEDKDQAETVREIVNLAAASGIQPSSITFPASTLGGAGGATIVGASGLATTTAPSGKAGASNLTQLTPVKGSPGLYVMPITVTQDPSAPVSYDKFISFLSRLEQNRRTAQVTSIALQPTTTNPNQLTFTLTLQKYIKP